MPDPRPVVLDLPDDLPPWLAAFVLEAQRETDTLRDNGAEQAAAVRTALLRKLVAAAQAYLDTELGRQRSRNRNRALRGDYPPRSP